MWAVNDRQQDVLIESGVLQFKDKAREKERQKRITARALTPKVTGSS